MTSQGDQPPDRHRRCIIHQVVVWTPSPLQNGIQFQDVEIGEWKIGLAVKYVAQMLSRHSQGYNMFGIPISQSNKDKHISSIVAVAKAWYYTSEDDLDIARCLCEIQEIRLLPT